MVIVALKVLLNKLNYLSQHSQPHHEEMIRFAEVHGYSDQPQH